MTTGLIHNNVELRIAQFAAAADGKLNVVLGEKGLAERVVNLL
jgi:hypothetical protein